MLTLPKEEVQTCMMLATSAHHTVQATLIL